MRFQLSALTLVEVLQIHVVSGRYTTCMPGYIAVFLKIQHVFVRTLDVVIDTQGKHLCLWMYSSCLCINNFNLIG